MSNHKNEDLNNLTQKVAKKIIENVVTGSPPEYGFQFYTVGLDPYIDTIEEEYFKTFIREGGAAFKMVVEYYGGGKTHFLYCLRERAWKYNFIASYIPLSPQETPFHQLDRIYQAIVKNLIFSQSPDELFKGENRGIGAVIKKWYFEKFQEFSQKVPKDSVLIELKHYISTLKDYDSTSFKNAIKEAFLSLAERSDENFSLIMQWLKGDPIYKNMVKKFNIFEKIDKSTAFKMIRSLNQWIQDINYTGIIVLMDEAEITSSMSSKQKDLLLNNLRILIDECARVHFKNIMWFYAVPDENFLEGSTQIYTALQQRVQTIFNAEINPAGVKIYLEKVIKDPIETLKQIGEKLALIFEKAQKIQFNKTELIKTIQNFAVDSYENRFVSGVKRYFVQKIIPAFRQLDITGNAVLPDEIQNGS
ncbi:hypothetical protein LCGC14_0970320 [marine sediment metagenome]|uniref:DUF2791 domain-containing protein n=1 Tax=marine sediment metagenome TaxID=412755 RepID=A0A0F9NGC1_9ZZZZ